MFKINDRLVLKRGDATFGDDTVAYNEVIEIEDNYYILVMVRADNTKLDQWKIPKEIAHKSFAILVCN
jgi:hypothetical protein